MLSVLIRILGMQKVRGFHRSSECLTMKTYHDRCNIPARTGCINGSIQLAGLCKSKEGHFEAHLLSDLELQVHPNNVNVEEYLLKYKNILFENTRTEIRGP